MSPLKRTVMSFVLAAAVAVPAGVATAETAQNLIGQVVIGAGGDTVGTVQNVTVDEGGEVSAIVVEPTGYLNSGGHEVALPWDSIRALPPGEGLVVDLSKEQVSELPPYVGPGAD